MDSAQVVVNISEERRTFKREYLASEPFPCLLRLLSERNGNEFTVRAHTDVHSGRAIMQTHSSAYTWMQHE